MWASDSVESGQVEMGETLLAEGEMRRNDIVGDAAKPFADKPRYYSTVESLNIGERSRELCSAAARISHRAELLVEASRDLERLSKELLSEAKAADSKGHESARSR